MLFLQLTFPLSLRLCQLERSPVIRLAVRVNHVHSAASILTFTVRGRGPVQSGPVIIRVFTGLMLSMDLEVVPVAWQEGGWGSICLSSPKATLISRQDRNVEGRFASSPRNAPFSLLLQTALTVRSQSRVWPSCRWVKMVTVPQCQRNKKQSHHALLIYYIYMDMGHRQNICM